MQASFDLPRGGQGEGQLAIEGMDDENPARTEIEISINGTQVFGGPNPLPDDDLPLESGTWATQVFAFDASLLVAGQNTITIRNRSPGAFGRPPFFMLDYADLSFTPR